MGSRLFILLFSQKNKEGFLYPRCLQRKAAVSTTNEPSIRVTLGTYDPPTQPLEGGGNKRRRTHTAKAPHSPSTGQLASGSHWLCIPASRPHQEPGSGSWAHPASMEQLKDKAGRGRWHRLGTRSQVGSCVRVTPTSQPLSFTLRMMTQPCLQVAS